MAVYADYTYYSTSFFGTAITEEDFPKYALRASAEIDRITFNRAASDTDNTTAIKNAMCAVAEELQKQDRSNGVDGIASESQGQYSVSYVAGSNRSQTSLEKIQNAAKPWLANTFLMFAGFGDDEYGA